MKSFYASCHCVLLNLNPLQTYLVVVGDLQFSGSVVLAASPLMKSKYNIKTGSRLYEIPRLKHIHIVEAKMGYYLDMSMKITRLLNSYVPIEAIHTYSVDESWATLNGTERLYGDAWNASKMIQQEIWDRFNLPCSIGIGSNKFLAKVILDIEAKKTGIAECRYKDVQDKLWGTPIEDIWGIANGLKVKLNKIGIHKFGQIAKTPLDTLKKQFGVIGEQLYWHSWGIDLSPIYNDYQEVHKGFSHGITLLRDYTNIEEIKIVILELCEEVCRRARQKQLAGCTVSLFIGYSRNEDGKGFNRSKTLDTYTNITIDIYNECARLFEKHYTYQSVRRISVGLSNLIYDDGQQLNLFEDKSKQHKLGYVMDSIRNKYGSDALLRAISYTNGGTMLDRSQKLGGHKK